MTNAGAPVGGVEQLMNSVLAGKPGEQRYETTPSGLKIPTGSESHTPAVPGRNVQTTIDADLQFVAQNALARAVTQREALNGYVVVQDVRTGKLLAVANYPTFDPADLGSRVVGTVLGPRPAPAAGAIETGVVVGVDPAPTDHAWTPPVDPFPRSDHSSESSSIFVHSIGNSGSVLAVHPTSSRVMSSTSRPSSAPACAIRWSA